MNPSNPRNKMLNTAIISLEYPPALDSTATLFPSEIILRPCKARSQIRVITDAANAIWLAILSFKE